MDVCITTFYVFIMSCIFHTFILFVHMCTIYRIDLHINIVENKYQNGFLLFVSIIIYEKINMPIDKPPLYEILNIQS